MKFLLGETGPPAEPEGCLHQSLKQVMLYLTLQCFWLGGIMEFVGVNSPTGKASGVVSVIPKNKICF